MRQLGNGLSEADHDKEALSVREAELSMLRRVGASEQHMLVVQTNLANSYHAEGRFEQALQLERDVYHESSRLLGEEDYDTLTSVNNYADSLFGLNRFEEAKSLLRKMIPVARRVLAENDDLLFRMRMVYGLALSEADGATLDDLREAVTTLEETEMTGRRVFGGAHPLTGQIENTLRKAREALNARETSPGIR